MKRNILVLIGAFILLYACNNAQNPATTETKPAVPADDSIRTLVIKVHDEAMPKIGKLIGLQQLAQKQIDSLSALKSPAAKALIQELTQMKQQLAAAQKGMDDWMAQVNLDQQLPTVDERAAYYNDQLTKAQKMRDDIFAALDSAAIRIKQ